MGTAPWAKVALSVASTAVVGSVVLLAGWSAVPVDASISHQRVVSEADLTDSFVAPREDQLFRPARALKTDRLPITALAHRLLRQDADRSAGALGYLPDQDATHAAFAQMPLAGALQPSELEPEALDDLHDTQADPVLATARPPSKPVLGYNIPAPPEKPDRPLANPTYATAAKASLVGAMREGGAPGVAAERSRFSLFSSLMPSGAGDTAKQRVASLGPQMDAPSRGPTVQTPFGVPYVLQTESVEGSCLKPELLGILRKIEGHYGQKVTLTSGARNRGRDGSLHKTCEAADIIMPGVDADALAAWVRKNIPEIGGVGTYCHPQMIHVDTGTPRDWKFGCGRSYFAMRDGSAGWGSKGETVTE